MMMYNKDYKYVVEKVPFNGFTWKYSLKEVDEDG